MSWLSLPVKPTCRISCRARTDPVHLRTSDKSGRLSAALYLTLGLASTLSVDESAVMGQLGRVIFARTSAFGHFGRAPEADGGFSWEKIDLADTLRALA